MTRRPAAAFIAPGPGQILIGDSKPQLALPGFPPTG
jgi:hypothetical protein